jgi:hypothetical protein
LKNVRIFLYEVKKLVSQGRRQFVRRQGYNVPDGRTINYVQALLELDIADVDEAIDTYIKLKTDERGCVCISFHRDWG